MTLFAVIICVLLLATTAYFVLLLSGETLVWIISRAARFAEERRVYLLKPSNNR